MEISQLTNSTGLLDSPTKTFDELKTEDFVKILVAQLSNQNPLQPLEDGQLIDQISSINGLQANSALAKTLESLSETLSGQGLAQSLGAASSLIGKSVSGTLGEQTITGVVDRAVVEEGEVFLMVGDSKLPLNSITEVQ